MAAAPAEERPVAVRRPRGSGARLASRVEVWLERLRSDPFSRARNHAALPNDLVGWWAVALLQLCLLLFKTVLRERQPLLAAVNTTNAVTALALAALIRRRPRLYAAARELLLFLASLHLSFVMVNGVLHGNSNVLTQHGGSPLRMLALLLVAGPSVALCLYALYTRLSVAWSAVALPLLAAAPAVLGGGPMCRRMLATPGGEAPLDTLHTVLALLHSVTFDLLPRGALPSPMQQCWQINAWALLAVGALLPLLVLRRWERTARRRWDAEQKCSAAGSQPVETPPSSSCAPAEGHGQEAEAEAGAGEDPQLQESAPLRPPGWWLLEPWLAGALLWQAAGLGAALLAPAA